MSSRTIPPILCVLFCLPFAGTYVLVRYGWMDLVRPDNIFWQAPSKFLFIASFASIAIIVASRVLRKDRVALVLAIMGMVHLGVQFFYRENVPQYDIKAHWSTIGYIADNLALQPIGEKFTQAHQAPLYYVTAAAIYNFSGWFGLRTMWVLNFVAYLFYCLFLLAAIRLMMELIRSRWLRYVLVVALMMWPASQVNCCRVTNDIPLYAVTMAFIYQAVCWYLYGYRKHFVYAVLLLSLGFLIKTSAVIMLVVLLLTAGFKWLQWGGGGQLTASLPPRPMLLLLGALLLICSTANTLRVAHYNADVGGKASYVHGVDEWRNWWRYSDIPAHYFTFDYTNFVKKPLSRNKYGFWDLHLKSFIYGKKNYSKSYRLATVLSFVFIVTYIIFMIQLFSRVFIQQAPIGVIEWLGGYYAISLLAVVSIQLLNPTFDWATIRHIYPVIPVVLTMFGCIAETSRDSNRRLYWLNAGMLTLLAALAAIFTFMQLFR